MLEGCIYSICVALWVQAPTHTYCMQYLVYLCGCGVYISTGALPKPTRRESHCGFSLSALFKQIIYLSIYVLSFFPFSFLKVQVSKQHKTQAGYFMFQPEQRSHS